MISSNFSLLEVDGHFEIQFHLGKIIKQFLQGNNVATAACGQASLGTHLLADKTERIVKGKDLGVMLKRLNLGLTVEAEGRCSLKVLETCSVGNLCIN